MSFMNKKIINEINQIKAMMGLKESEVDEQAVSAASKGVEAGQRGTDEEYKLLGAINLFMESPLHDKKNFNDMGDQMDWIRNYKSKIGNFGEELFNYLQGNTKEYDQHMFDALIRVFNTEGVYTEMMGVKEPTDAELIQSGKNTKDFKYNMSST